MISKTNKQKKTKKIVKFGKQPYIKVIPFLDHVSWPSFVENFYFFGYIAQMHMALNPESMEGVWGTLGTEFLSCPSAPHFQQAPLAVSNPWRDGIAMPADVGVHFIVVSDYHKGVGECRFLAWTTAPLPSVSGSSI